MPGRRSEPLNWSNRATGGLAMLLLLAAFPCVGVAEPSPPTVEPPPDPSPPPLVVQAEPGPTPTVKARRGGAGLDFGISGVLPDVGLLLAYRPLPWIQLMLGPGYNGISPGIRTGVTIASPYVLPLSLTWEGGHYFEGDANRAVRWFRNDFRDVTSLKHFSYNYMNLLVGFSFDWGGLNLYVRGGITWMQTTVRDFSRSVNELAKVDLAADDPVVRYRGPTLKLGFYFFP